MRKWVIGLAGIGILGIVVGCLLISLTFISIEPNYMGLHFNGNTIELDEDTLYFQGRYYFGINHKFIIYPMGLIQINESVQARSSDGLKIACDFSVQFYLNSTIQSVLKVFHAWGENGLESGISRIAKGEVRNSFGSFSSSQIISQMLTLKSKIKTQLSSIFSTYYVNVDNFEIVNIVFPSSFYKAMQDSENAKANLTCANNRLLEAISIRDGEVSKQKTELQIITNEANAYATQLSFNQTSDITIITNYYSMLKTALLSYKNNIGLPTTTTAINRYNYLINYYFLKIMEEFQNPFHDFRYSKLDTAFKGQS